MTPRDIYTDHSMPTQQRWSRHPLRILRYSALGWGWGLFIALIQNIGPHRSQANSLDATIPSIYEATVVTNF